MKKSRPSRRRRRNTDPFFKKENGKKESFFGEQKNKPFFDAAPKGVTQNTGQSVGFANGKNVSIQGKTTASYSNSWGTAKHKEKKGGDCIDCETDKCKQVSGKLVSRFNVKTSISIQKPANYKSLKKCEKAKVNAAIKNELMPHEKEHVKAFNKYKGVTVTPYNFSACPGELQSKLQDMHDNLEDTRRQMADDASAALDPFVVNIDLDCTKKKPKPKPKPKTPPVK